ncbi:hypothetical protein V493_04841 [Pseudogymnoascus sp. VKM F-4281 (FW-2241)]|nr:hypothetical protein V493_04841 [Pseudogymnoascus sp. VKM F-4281 (FW-2241)]
MRRSTSQASASTTGSDAHKTDGAASMFSYLANTVLKEKPSEHTPATSDDESSGDNIFYLAYGSNLASKTFLGMRGIRPLSQKNVHCPILTLTFDLGGFPYLEPCFANTRYTADTPPPGPPGVDYHKTHWKKGVVGVVYEVTKQDFLKIMATEGGGASYQDVIVPCYPLASDIDVVPEVPTGEPFDAHTLYSPWRPGGLNRPDPNHAQPSPRYLNLLISGAAEHNLPDEYREYLAQIRPYVATSLRQKIGRIAFAAVWTPIIIPIMMISRKLVDDKGRAPGWFNTIMDAMKVVMWGSYDIFYKRVYGEGERTIESQRPARFAEKKDEVKPKMLEDRMRDLQDALEEAGE